MDPKKLLTKSPQAQTRYDRTPIFWTSDIPPGYIGPDPTQIIRYGPNGEYKSDTENTVRYGKNGEYSSDSAIVLDPVKSPQTARGADALRGPGLTGTTNSHIAHFQTRIMQERDPITFNKILDLVMSNPTFQSFQRNMHTENPATSAQAAILSGSLSPEHINKQVVKHRVPGPYDHSDTRKGNPLDPKNVSNIQQIMYDMLPPEMKKPLKSRQVR